MSIVQRKAFLKKDGFTQHKTNARGNTIIYSRKHSTEKFVRIVVDSGIDKNTNKICGQAKAKLVYINRENHWRVITKEVSSSTIPSLVQSQSNLVSSVPQCKHCNAKKFTAKSGNVVCANACWTTWGNKKKSQKTTEKKSPITSQKKPQKKSPNKDTEKINLYTLDLKSGDLVTVEKHNNITGEILKNFEGEILGIVTKVHDEIRMPTIVWTANTSTLEEYQLPYRIQYTVGHTVQQYSHRFKVLSRKVEWVIT